ncbi:complement factor H like 3 [Danio aesculapii]|uniref:complement factor H like 3 n=1 Tax=Danio aesculapii TaxID=1142201 RepID=UPI0024C0C9F3|nr:complement factor H like 3 [Danio aesculapii]
MQAPVQIHIFFCFLFSVTFVQCQECLQEQITHENIEPVEKVSYADGETVKLNCMTGYFGFYKLKCNNGQWQTFIARSCSKKKCGHPGETPNGSFKLIEERDYVYGATVEYTCKKGYEMASRNNRRHCRIKGWDNSIPVCEEVRCPVIHTDGTVIALGNTVEGAYADVIHFQCVSSNKSLDGNNIIHCMENGNWSGPVPQCIVTCQFDVTETGAIKPIPEGKTVFRAGETVGLICSGINSQFFRQETFTCTNNGKWDYKPTCKEIKCEVPHGQNVYLPNFYFTGDLLFGAKRSYSCDTGYRKVSEEATCTRDGWSPKPLCAEMMCDPPRLPNAAIVGGQKRNYRISSTIEYKCRPGFEPEELVRITCDSQGQWTGIQQCSDGTCQEQELKKVKVLFGYPTFTSPYKPGHVLVFQCTDDNMRFYGHRAIECQSDGRWNYPYPQCGGNVQCSQPIKNMQYVTVSDMKTIYSNLEILRYTCNEPYNQIPDGALLCQNGQWNGTFDCRSSICPPPPYIKNGDYSTISKTADNVITAVSYTCQSFFVLNKQQENFKCVNGIWETPPKCLKPCEIDKIVEKYNLQLPTEKVYIKHADTYRLNCRDGWNTGSEVKAYVDVSCSNGNLQFDQSCDTQNK